MTWFRVDDKSAFHRKVTDVGNEAWGALCRAGAWSSDHLTDGRVPWSVALTIASKKIWERLFVTGLCERLEGTTDFLIHDFLDWNPSKEQVLELRQHRSQAGRRGGVAKREAKAKQVSSNGSSKTEAKFCPSPVPVPKEETENGAHTPRADPTYLAIRDRIRHWPIFDSLNADRLADEQVGRMMTSGQLVAWVVQAIDDCAAKCADGTAYQAKHSMLVGFMHRARRPRDEDVAEPRRVVESKEDPALIERARAARAEQDKRNAERLAREAARKAGAK